MLKQYQEPVIQSLALEDKDNPKKVQLFLKREDLIHPTVSGNKWRKLKYNLAFATQAGYDKVLTFGGAYSNHLYAVAAAAKELGLSSIGVVRGEETLPLNPTLSFAKEQGMSLTYMSRSDYREKESQKIKQELKDRFGKFYLIPEGGTNPMALMGAAEIMAGIDNKYDEVILAAGTGGTMAGIVSGLNGSGFVTGIPVLKGDFMDEEIRKHLASMGLGQLTNFRCIGDYHFGGYAKFNDSLIQFINTFHAKYNIPLDPIYTGKMLYGVFDLIGKGYFPENSRILAIHTGGLQGIAGFNERHGEIIET